MNDLRHKIAILITVYLDHSGDDVHRRCFVLIDWKLHILEDKSGC